MTTPDVFATGEGVNSLFNVPSGQSDGPRLVVRTATVPDSSTVGTIIGLVPFQKGAILEYGSTLAIDDLDTATDVTLDWGFIYTDNDTVNNINDTNAFAAAATTAQAGGILRPTATAGATFVATADGWIAVTTAGGSTTTAGDITLNGTISYQG